MRTALRGWAATLGASGLAAIVLLTAALLAGGGGEAVVSVVIALCLGLGVIAFSLPVLAAMGLAPTVAFLVAMSTYALQVLLGAVLLRAGRPGGALADVIDQGWLGVALVTLALAVTCGVVADQLRAARSISLRDGLREGPPRDESPQTAPSPAPPQH